MVAPTRTPQARGVKCDLCKKILALATWLDQTKLAKEVEEAQTVLNLIKQHQQTTCPCIPKSIENLLVGSTHFEIHRLVAKKLDCQIHKRQYEYFIEAKQKVLNESRSKNVIINDCHDNTKGSRFKIYIGYNDQKHCERSKQQLRHLCRSIDYWRAAMEDQTNPFNAKLALRLGLTHHVIYACYLFKYYKILDYQLITSNLLLNLFKTIEGVTANAQLHASYLVVKTLVDCNQLHLARQLLKTATKSSNYSEKAHYESILLTCAECELKLLEGIDIYSSLDELAELVVIKPDDKLQHYYARTLAMSLLVKYIHCYPSKSDYCFEFFHTFRFICAIIRRCYESSFELVLAEKDLTRHQQQQSQHRVKTTEQIVDHSWIRFAVCDFVFSSFELLVRFYMRAGMPDALELLYNGLNLIAFRTGSCYWQSRIVAIGADLDLLCDKLDHAKLKLDVLSRIFGYTSDPYLMNLLRLESEIGLLAILDQEGSVINKDVILDLLERIKSCRESLLDRLSQIELYEVKLSTSVKFISNQTPLGSKWTSCVDSLILKSIKIGVSQSLRRGEPDCAHKLVEMLKQQVESMNVKVLQFNECQAILEMLLSFANIENSDRLLLETVESSTMFLKDGSNHLDDLETQLSTLTLNNEPATKSTLADNKVKSKPKMTKARRSRRKGTYEVAVRSRENLNTNQVCQLHDVIGTLVNYTNLTKEELIISYLRNSEPNPDYLLYRKAHELIFCIRLQDCERNSEQLVYHFGESSAANTMRYRWMMLEEQSISPYESIKQKTSAAQTKSITINKQLSFCNHLTSCEKSIRSMARAINDDSRVVQFKYILDEPNRTEHLICCALEHHHALDPLYFHTKRTLSSDRFFEDALAMEDNASQFSLPNQLSQQIDESRKALLNTNQRVRNETRQRIETELGVILHDIENDLLGPFRFVLCGKVLDGHYHSLISELVEEVLSIMESYECASLIGLRWFLENAPLLNRDEFCRMISILFKCTRSAQGTRECFTKWLKSLETFISKHGGHSNKTSYLQSLDRGQLGLILDNKLELVPFESTPIVRITRQGIFRVPSLRMLSILESRRSSPIKVDPNEAAYILDPASNLTKTRDRFESKLASQNSWLGTIGHPPAPEQLEHWLTSKQIYIFIGHGAGTTYYNSLCKGHGLSFMSSIESVAVVMGCSSGRMQAEGPKLESFGVGWLFIFRGAPCYAGLLWDVTDADIDKFTDSFLAKWLPSKWSLSDANNSCSKESGDRLVDQVTRSIADAIAQSRQVCQLKLLVGATPVVYGLPVWTKQ